MKRCLKRSILGVAGVTAIGLIAAQIAYLQPEVPVARSPVQVTPQAVVIGENTSGTTKIAKVTVTNISKQPVHANVLWGVEWLQVSPASVDLEPGKSTRLTITGNLGRLEQVVNPPSREDQVVQVDQRPVCGVAPVTVSTGDAGTLFVVFGVRMDKR